MTPQQLRHRFATPMVSAGVSLRSLMALLGPVSAEMSLTAMGACSTPPSGPSTSGPSIWPRPVLNHSRPGTPHPTQRWRGLP
ncbi:MAG: hypothetical protein M0Z29_08160 [Actinomycetota bacterium]|nr:hypothetical protein [Actinomycetota bacterium]